MPNIYSQIPEKLSDELFEEIVHGDSFVLERIVSKGHATPKGEWYDQDRDEWVILLKGSAGIIIEGEPKVITLKPGDHLHLPAHQKHRVEWTEAETETIWLAAHYKSHQ
jgi:cupin 2 domain-containing protein